jgi:hypothetical protein
MTIKMEEKEEEEVVAAAGAAVAVGNSNAERHKVFPDGWNNDAVDVYVRAPNRTFRTIGITAPVVNTQNHQLGPHYDLTITHNRPIAPSEIDAMIRRVRQSESGDVIILERRFPETELVRVYNSNNELIGMYPRSRAASPDPADGLMLPNVIIVDRESASGRRSCCRIS